MDIQTIERIDALIRREVVPATGCTEPACVSLAVAYAAALLPRPLQSISVALSGNMLKNAMGVGIPGTGMTGLPIAIALGAVAARPCLELEMLESISPEELEEAKSWVARDVIEISYREGVDKLYVEARITSANGHEARCIIQQVHTRVTLLELDGVDKIPALEACCEGEGCLSPTDPDIELSYDLVYDYATTAPLERLTFIYEGALQNKRVSQHALEHSYGHNVGKLVSSPTGQQYLGNSPLMQMISYTSGACDARMDGASLTVVSNSGSGNQGITATLPVLTFAETQGASVEQTTRALMLSGLMVVYIKQQLGRLSSLCGMVISGIGASAALVYLLGGSKQQSGYAVRNMIGNVTGMICDGAKPGCSLKASSGISSAMISALLAMQESVVTEVEGIVTEDIDACVRNLVLVGRDGMLETDKKILELMTSKGKSVH